MAELDPTLPLMVKPPVIQTPDEAQATALQMQGMKQQQQIGAMGLVEKQRQMASETALNNAMSQSLGTDGTLDMQQLGKNLAGTPAAIHYPEIAKSYSAMQQAQMAVQEGRQKVAAGEADAQGALAAAADVPKDPQEKARVLDEGLHDHFVKGLLDAPTYAAIMGRYHNPDGTVNEEAVPTLIARMQANSKEQTRLNTERMTAQSRADQAATGAKRLTLETPKYTQEARAEAAGRLATAKTADEYGQILDEYPTSVGRAFPPPEQWDAKTTPAQIQQLGQTPEQQVTTAQGAQRIGVSQGELSVAQRRANTAAGQLTVSQAREKREAGKVVPGQEDPMHAKDLSEYNAYLRFKNQGGLDPNAPPPQDFTTWRAQVKSRDVNGQPVKAAAPPPATAPPPVAPPAGFAVGKSVTLKNGRKVTVTKINGDGTFEHTP